MFVQAVTLYNAKSTHGYSTDFAVIAWLGFLLLVFN
jgi:hypothetical protein